MRLFVALEIPSAVREKFATLIGDLRAAAGSPQSKFRPRWVPPENLHVTLKFVGHVDQEKAVRIQAALSQVRCPAPVELRFRGLGFFPNGNRPRVLWAGMETSPNLPPLAAEIDFRVEQFGIPRETREFSPHLTLARFDPPGISNELRAAVDASSSREFGFVRAREFHLFESQTRSTGAVYTRLASFTFTGPGD